mmetsp:Transcript_7114/g.9851  ORF Transcript_7114/g.9851 Transcript_7114/m.9851 type:complete len:92 (+) Transcript_7114:217-492(+)
MESDGLTAGADLVGFTVAVKGLGLAEEMNGVLGVALMGWNEGKQENGLLERPDDLGDRVGRTEGCPAGEVDGPPVVGTVGGSVVAQMVGEM